MMPRAELSDPVSLVSLVTATASISAALRPQLSQAIASQFAAVAEHRLLLPRGTFLWDCDSVLL